MRSARLLAPRAAVRTDRTATYRVVLARRDGDTLYASVVLADAAPTRWIPAHWEDSDASSYGVDAGTGCFADAATAAAWAAMEAALDEENLGRVKASGVDPADADACHAAYSARDAERPNVLARLRAAGYDRRPYAAPAIDGPAAGRSAAPATACIRPGSIETTCRSCC